MIIDIGTEVDESVIRWKHKETDEWQEADIDELIHLYESIVRCKDCRHWQKTNIETIDGEPIYDCPFCGEWADANGFCSFGERREPLPQYEEWQDSFNKMCESARPKTFVADEWHRENFKGEEK